MSVCDVNDSNEGKTTDVSRTPELRELLTQSHFTGTLASEAFRALLAQGYNYIVRPSRFLGTETHPMVEND